MHTQRGERFVMQTQIWHRQTHQINIRHWLCALPSLLPVSLTLIYIIIHLSSTTPLFLIICSSSSHPNTRTHTSRTTTATHFEQIHRKYLSFHRFFGLFTTASHTLCTIKRSYISHKYCIFRLPVSYLITFNDHLDGNSFCHFCPLSPCFLFVFL